MWERDPDSREREEMKEKLGDEAGGAEERARFTRPVDLHDDAVETTVSLSLNGTSAPVTTLLVFEEVSGWDVDFIVWPLILQLLLRRRDSRESVSEGPLDDLLNFSGVAHAGSCLALSGTGSLLAAQSKMAGRMIDAFDYRSRACDIVFGAVYALPRVPRRLLRDRENLMELYNNQQFLLRYRFSKETVRELQLLLPLEASGNSRGLPLSPMLQLLLALRFYGAGSFQIVTGDLINVSQPTVCGAVDKVTRLIARHLFRKLVHFPELSQFASMHETSIYD
ncbi:hypothetical protein HPB49_011306 [Dermacentor silvarum]|uniref:Uncharacterized protein n=1 Tax=Dermacentor silvarum TaxID=543639 RepID=A0ACB8C8Z1_DERSI|nr:hypothetical protein HPB49_011306 [Dermacentor silvarum]